MNFTTNKTKNAQTLAFRHTEMWDTPMETSGKEAVVLARKKEQRSEGPVLP